MPFNIDIQKQLKGHKVKPPKIADKLTNRELREMNLLSLARKFKPSAPKAIHTMTSLLNASDTPGVRFNAAKFIVDFYLEVVKGLYKEKYDKDLGDDIQPILQVHDSTNLVQLPESEDTKDNGYSKNRTLREKQLMMLSRKLKPHVRKAMDTLNELNEGAEVAPAIRFQASKYLIMINKHLTENIYADKYDVEEDELEKEAVPTFSLKVVK
jgi:hypothetical protein